MSEEKSLVLSETLVNDLIPNLNNSQSDNINIINIKKYEK